MPGQFDSMLDQSWNIQGNDCFDESPLGLAQTAADL
jgi:hypothetical protein